MFRVSVRMYRYYNRYGSIRFLRFSGTRDVIYVYVQVYACSSTFLVIFVLLYIIEMIKLSNSFYYIKTVNV